MARSAEKIAIFVRIKRYSYFSDDEYRQIRAAGGRDAGAGPRVARSAQTDLSRQPQLGVSARRGRVRGFRPGEERVVRRRRGRALGGARRLGGGRGAHRGVLQPREGGARGAADGRLRIFRIRRRPAGRRPAFRRGAHVARRARHGGGSSRATSSSRSTRIPTTRPITRSCSRTTASATTSTSTVSSGAPTSRRRAPASSTGPSGSTRRRAITSNRST